MAPNSPRDRAYNQIADSLVRQGVVRDGVEKREIRLAVIKALSKAHYRLVTSQQVTSVIKQLQDGYDTGEGPPSPTGVPKTVRVRGPRPKPTETDL